MQEVADWLARLGMSEYAQRFAENNIDMGVLGELTDADFDRLGLSIGHRRKLLKALAAGAAPQLSSPRANPLLQAPSFPKLQRAQRHGLRVTALAKYCRCPVALAPQR